MKSINVITGIGAIRNEVSIIMKGQIDLHQK